ncbi:type II secretion system F family protein [Candidatus Woesebacteria bacterium]|nr:type II secretion system F family protein [Candidatus Woesebacteria bacterium]
MRFSYTAISNGKEVKDTLEANSTNEVVEFLKSQGIFPINVVEKKASLLDRIMGLFDRVSFSDVTFITRQLAIMLDAGLTLIDSLEIIKKQTKKKSLVALVSDIDKSLREGSNFSQAITRYPKYFSNFYIALVKSGEASGKLDIVLSKLAKNLEDARTFRKKIRNAMIYPVVIIIGMISMIFVLLTFVVPRLLELYGEFDVELPATTKALIAISSFFESNWVYILIFVGVIVFGLRRLLKTTLARSISNKIMLELPVVGPVIKTSSLVDTTRTLSILINSGVSILESLEIVTDVSTNLVYKNAFKEITKKVEKGFSLGQSMSNAQVFPETLVQMAIVGEQTGHLDETLSKISEYYQTESELAIRGLLSLVEPSIIAVLGLVVGLLVSAVITPIFSLTSSI